jgi:hypothetical protein
MAEALAGQPASRGAAAAGQPAGADADAEADGTPALTGVVPADAAVDALA